MRNLNLKVFAAVVVCLTTFAPLPSATANPTDIAQLAKSLDELDAWVGGEANGAKWRKFLMSEELREQMARGAEADPAVVSRVLQQYKSGVNGLGKRRFVEVRSSIRSWLDALRGQYENDLSKLAWAARGDHEPVDEQRIDEVRNRLRTEATRLEARLGGDSQFAQGWKDYLRWESLEPHFSSDVAITGQSLRDLDAVLRRLRSNKPGLEHPVFTNTADAVEQYRELAFWYALGQRRDTRPRYESFLLELEKQVVRNQEKPTVEAARQIGKVVGLIQQLGHSVELAEDISEEFGRSNIRLEVSSAAIQQIVQRPVNETSPVRDCILGARVRGTANSSGVLSVRTRPSSTHIALDLQLAGNIQSRTFSYKKPVRVGSTGSTNFVATKQLEINDERFRVLPASASAKTRTRTGSIKKTGGKFGHKLIERIARKKVAESKPQAEYIAARHAEVQVAEKFDRQVVEALYEARQNYDNKLRPPLQRIGMFPDELNMSSTSSNVQIDATLASYKQITTDRLPPGLRTDNDFAFQLHESAVNNFVPFILAGAKIGQSDESEAPTIQGDVPGWLKKLSKDPKVKEQFAEKTAGSADSTDDTSSPDFKPWEFVLNSDHPLSVSFADGKVTIRIRIAELKTFEDGEESVQKNWDFLITYRVTQQGNRVVLEREGKIEALPTGFDPVWFGDPRWDDKLTGRQVGIRKNLEDNINKRVAGGGGLPLEIALPPAELPLSENVSQELLLQQLECDNGWLTVGYQLP